MALFTSRFACAACNISFLETVERSERDKQVCPDCGGVMEDRWWTCVPQIQKKEIEMRTHGSYMTDNGKVVLTDKKSEVITRAQWEAKKAITAAKQSGDKEGQLEATRDLAAYAKEGLKDIGKDRPAQTAEYNGKKIQ